MQRAEAGRISPLGVTSVSMHKMCERTTYALICHIITVLAHYVHRAKSQMPL